MNTNEPTSHKPLRLWPGVAAAVLLVLVGFVVPIVMPRYAGLGMIGAVACALLVILWWLFFSRARWYERLGAIVLMIVAAFAAAYRRPPVDCRRRDGQLDLHPRDSDPERRARRLGGGEPSARARSSRRRGGRRRRARMPAVDAAPDRWHQRRRTVGFPLAVDDDSRGAAPRAGRRRTEAGRAGGRLPSQRSYRRNRCRPRADAPAKASRPLQPHRRRHRRTVAPVARR